MCFVAICLPVRSITILSSLGQPCFISPYSKHVKFVEKANQWCGCPLDPVRPELPAPRSPASHRVREALETVTGRRTLYAKRSWSCVSGLETMRGSRCRERRLGLAISRAVVLQDVASCKAGAAVRSQAEGRSQEDGDDSSEPTTTNIRVTCTEHAPPR